MCCKAQFWGHFHFGYIHHLTENVQGAKLVLFADYTNLLIIWKDEFDLQHKIINVMRDMKKTILYTEIRVPSRPQIIFKNINISYQSELRFLGIYIMENLTQLVLDY
jgi:hypothetical protein